MSGPYIEDPSLAKLISQAGPRRGAPAAVTEQVREAAHGEWLQLLQQRRRHQHIRWLAAASVLIAIVGIISVSWQTSKPTAELASTSSTVLAEINHLSGSAQLNQLSASTTQSIHANELLLTAAESGARITTSTGISLRVAAASELRWLNDHELQLLRGALYVDSHNNAAELVIHTPLAQVTHVGTQYQVSTSSSGLIVAVRSGQASIHDATNAPVSVYSSEQVHMDANGHSVRTPLANDDASWQWVDMLIEPFVVENRNVADFLQWVADATGYQLRYTSVAAQAAANTTVLHGHSTRMAPLQAMQVVLATTDLRASIQGAQLVVSQQ
ncbi:MAG: FecR family protein [Steroidobacteraceae bacterium]